jgi:hypothetical protein
MAAFMAAIHFPEADQYLHCFWKMDGRDKPGHDVVEWSFYLSSAYAIT